MPDGDAELGLSSGGWQQPGGRCRSGQELCPSPGTGISTWEARSAGWADGASQLARISPTAGTETNIRHLGGIKATARKRIPHILGFSSPVIPFLWAPSELSPARLMFPVHPAPSRCHPCPGALGVPAGSRSPKQAGHRAPALSHRDAGEAPALISSPSNAGFGGWGSAHTTACTGCISSQHRFG